MTEVKRQWAGKAPNNLYTWAPARLGHQYYGTKYESFVIAVFASARGRHHAPQRTDVHQARRRADRKSQSTPPAAAGHFVETGAISSSARLRDRVTGNCVP